MISAGRRLVSVAGRRHLLRLLSVVVVVFGLLSLIPTTSSAEEDGVTISITSVSPSVLKNGDTVELRGVITNHTAADLSDVQAYLVIPSAPFRTRSQIQALLDDAQNAFGGRRVVQLDRIADLKNLAAGSSERFRLRVPYSDLEIDGSEGVYPVGVHVLGTVPDGTRDVDGLARAYTFVPKIDHPRPIDTSVVWPFTSPVHRQNDGTYAGYESFIESVSEGGRLRNYLDLARSSHSPAISVLIDPSLLVALQDIADNRAGPPNNQTEGDYGEDQRQAARSFLDDLLAFAEETAAWILCYGRPAVVAFDDGSPSSREVIASIREVTTSALDSFETTGRRVTWPYAGLADERTINASRENGEMPIIVTPQSLPDWETRHGSLLSVTTGEGPMPVLVDDPLFGGSRNESVVTLRQLMLARTALAVLDHGANRDSAADATFVMDPLWNPTRSSSGELYEALKAPWVRAVDVETRLTSTPPIYDELVGATSKTPTLPPALVSDVNRIMDHAALRGELTSPEDATYFTQFAAELMSVRWINDGSEAVAEAQKVVERLRSELAAVSVDGPRQVTLSSNAGRFPLTVSNDLDAAVTVGVTVTADVSGVTLPEPAVVEIGAGQRTTLTLDIDLRDRAGATLTARVTTPDGDPLGSDSSFTVRSSPVGVVIWVAMGVAGLFVLFAVGRRLHRSHRGSVSHE